MRKRGMTSINRTMITIAVTGMNFYILFEVSCFSTPYTIAQCLRLVVGLIPCFILKCIGLCISRLCDVNKTIMIKAKIPQLIKLRYTEGTRLCMNLEHQAGRVSAA